MTNLNKKSICRALANDTRVSLLACLSKPHNVTDLLKMCHLSQSALSQHLKVLRDAGAVVAVKDGKNVVYKVKTKEVANIANLILKLNKK